MRRHMHLDGWLAGLVTGSGWLAWLTWLAGLACGCVGAGLRFPVGGPSIFDSQPPIRCAIRQKKENLRPMSCLSPEKNFKKKYL